MPYAVIDPEGNVRYLVGGVQEAVQAASQFSPYVQVEHGASEPEDAQLAGLGARMELPQVALAASGISPQPFPRMSLEEAHAKLLPYFPKVRYVLSKKVDGKRVFFDTPKQVVVQSYSTPKKMADKILGQNYKTAKVDEESDVEHEAKADVQGLSILPAVSYREAAQKAGATSACVGANPACRSACLVYSGHNTIDAYNVMIKAARTQALVHEPQAFIRMLAEAIGKHARIKTAQPYVRLNVFSDLPWELICPDLFHEFKSLQFYDYTKVNGRTTPSNYDLTFSFSGTNHERVASELARGRRIAVVFIPPVRIPAKGRPRGAGLPKFIDSRALFGADVGEIPVEDGDVSDVRPRDAGKIVVGLRWKVPMGRQVEAFAQAQRSAFAVPVQDLGNGVLVASTSARQEPIYDADDDDDEDDLLEVA